MALTVKAHKWLKTLSKRDFALSQVLMNFATRVQGSRSQDNIVEDAKDSIAEIKHLFEADE